MQNTTIQDDDNIPPPKYSPGKPDLAGKVSSFSVMSRKNILSTVVKQFVR